jgi:hypothetical protein
MLYIRPHTKGVRLYVLNVGYLNRKWKYGQQEIKIWTTGRENMDNRKSI